MLERLTHADLIGVVRDLIGEVTRMQAETEKLGGALAKLRVDHQAVKDELARLKHLPPRPPIKPSGMDKSTQAKGPEAGDEKGGRSSRRRGSQLDRLKIGAIIVVKADPPAGSRNKGFEDIVVQDLSLNPQVTRYRRERWETPDGKTIIAASWACRRLWPPSASPGVDASLLRASHLRTDHRSSQWHGRGDFEAAGGAFADGQTRAHFLCNLLLFTDIPRMDDPPAHFRRQYRSCSDLAGSRSMLGIRDPRAFA